MKRIKEQEKMPYKFVHFAHHLHRRSWKLIRNGRGRFHFALSTFLFDYIFCRFIDLFTPFSFDRFMIMKQPPLEAAEP